MPAAGQKELLDRLILAVEEGGGQASLVSKPGSQPRCFQVALADRGFMLWTYLWTITHGGKTRGADEFRIQMTSVASPLRRNSAGPTVLLGWFPADDVYAAYDVHRHVAFSGRSPSLQVSRTALRDAANLGWAFYLNQKNEFVVTFRPDQLLNYVASADILHREGPTAIALLQAALKSEPGSESAAPSEPLARQRLVETIERYVRLAGFRRQVTTAYQNRCAVTGWQLRLIDAAHILPVGAPGSVDRVGNGICLSPTMHRAFDHGLIFLDEKLHMRLNKNRADELERSNFGGGLRDFAQALNQPILLPPDANQHPQLTFIRLGNRFRGISD